MDCTFTGRTLILSKATKPSRDDSEQLREVIKISGHIELEAFAVMMGCAQTEIANWWPTTTTRRRDFSTWSGSTC